MCIIGIKKSFWYFAAFLNELYVFAYMWIFESAAAADKAEKSLLQPQQTRDSSVDVEKLISAALFPF